MAAHVWQLQEAKAKFSQLAREAKLHGAQIITIHGNPELVILSMPEYLKLTPQNSKKESAVSLLKIMQEAGLQGLKIERDQSLPREEDLFE